MVAIADEFKLPVVDQFVAAVLMDLTVVPAEFLARLITEIDLSLALMLNPDKGPTLLEAVPPELKLTAVVNGSPWLTLL